MFHTSEIRWFFDGPIPRIVREWVRASDLGADESERTDRYLILPGCETVGVKARAGRLEVKGQVGVSVPIDRFGVSGDAQNWVKWSRRLDSVRSVEELLGAPVGSSAEWIGVHKRRYLRTFSIDSGEPTEVDATTCWTQRGYQLELTAIRVLERSDGSSEVKPECTAPEGPTNWTMCIETFGDTVRGIDGLSIAMEYLLESAPRSELQHARSASYPTWMHSLG